jgi:hypothetical protein
MAFLQRIAHPHHEARAHFFMFVLAAMILGQAALVMLLGTWAGASLLMGVTFLVAAIALAACCRWHHAADQRNHAAYLAASDTAAAV